MKKAMTMNKPITINARKLLPLLLLALGGCASVGPKVIVDTPEPAEDIVAVCEKSKDYFLPLHGSDSYIVTDSVHVVKSGELIDCGVIFFGEPFGVSVMHPIYTGDGKQNYEKDGIKHIVLNKTKLEVLEEQRAKFEAGYWDKYANPGYQYAKNLTGCGFPYQYFDYYSKVKKVDVEHFKRLYNDPIEQCLSITTPIYKKYQPRSSKKLPDAETWMKIFWSPEKWKKYQ